MYSYKKSTILSMVATALFMVVVICLLCFGHILFKMYYIDFRGFSSEAYLKELASTLSACVYPGCVLGIVTLTLLFKMLLNIYKQKVFIKENIIYLRVISWCCIIVAVLTGYCAISYMPLTVVAASAAFMGIIVRVVKNVMQTAIALREENDLTI